MSRVMVPFLSSCLASLFLETKVAYLYKAEKQSLGETSASDLKFEEGDMITVNGPWKYEGTAENPEGWLKGINKTTGKIGLFSADNVSYEGITDYVGTYLVRKK